jgi:hypothetical protein
MRRSGGVAWVKSIVQPTAGNVVYLAQIGMVEIAAALSRKVRTLELRRDDYEAALGLFLTDVRNAEFTLIPVGDQIIEFAVDLTGRHPLRGYDAVHLKEWSDRLLAFLGPVLAPVHPDGSLLPSTEQAMLRIAPTSHEMPPSRRRPSRRYRPSRCTAGRANAQAASPSQSGRLSDMRPTQRRATGRSLSDSAWHFSQRVHSFPTGRDYPYQDVV